MCGLMGQPTRTWMGLQQLGFCLLVSIPLPFQFLPPPLWLQPTSGHALHGHFDHFGIVRGHPVSSQCSDWSFSPNTPKFSISASSCRQHLHASSLTCLGPGLRFTVRVASLLLLQLWSSQSHYHMTCLFFWVSDIYVYSKLYSPQQVLSGLLFLTSTFCPNTVNIYASILNSSGCHSMLLTYVASSCNKYLSVAIKKYKTSNW